MKIVFMGTPDFAVPTLKALHAGGHDILAVYTQPPRPAGRGKRERKSAVHVAAESLGLEVRTPKSFKDASVQAEFAALAPACAVVVAYGQILPQAVLDVPRFGCVNVHASLLPRWRGAAPIHRAIMAGDEETGVCIMQMEAGLDTGPVIEKASVPIDEDATTAKLHDELASLGAELINPALAALDAGTAQPAPQPGEGVTYAHKIDKAEARIDWGASARVIDRQVRGLFPFPGAWSEMAGERIKILGGSVRNAAEELQEPGTAVDDALLIACGEGCYQIERAQRAGKAAMDRDEFLRGFAVPAGTRFGG